MYIARQIDTSTFPINCPDHKCRKNIQNKDIESLLTKEEYERFTRFEWKWTRDCIRGTKECPSPNCDFYVEVETDDGENKFNCPSCEKTYCLTCKVAFHEGLTCEEYAKKEGIMTANQINNMHLIEDDQMLELAAKLNYRQCQQCKFWVEKNTGCNHMTCRCKHNFCYQCGGKWGVCVHSNYNRYDPMNETMIDFDLNDLGLANETLLLGLPR